MNFKKLGLICGLEIHQQLDTGKLFCSCPTLLRDDPADIKVTRKLRAVAGEQGKTDIAAAHEQLKNKTFLYEGFHDTTCLIELDEAPPKPINDAALHAALQTALLMNSSITQTAQVMRKTVVDGSNTSGFQRTALIAYSGAIKTKDGNVGISSVCIEEDSARPMQEHNNTIHYRLDRLGIPLIEIATEPDIHSPEQAKEAAEKIGMILRSTGKVKRGLGTIRQDVNVSIKDGARVEIKGAQDLKMVPALVQHEAERQVNLLEITKELKKRKAKVIETINDLTPLFKSSESKIIKNAINNKSSIYAIKLPGFAGLIGKELQPNRRLGSEFADHAKVRAGVGGIFHSDELPNYGIAAKEITAIKKKLRCTRYDGFILVAAPKEQATTALEAVIERAQTALKGVPTEVRKAQSNGTTTYLRPMPGAARMYPETDIQLITTDTKSITLPELIEEKVKRYVKEHNLSIDQATFIAKSPRAALFEELTKKHKDIKPAYIAEILTGTMRELQRDYNLDPSPITDDNLRELFSLLSQGKLHKDIMLDALIDTARGTFNINKFAGLKTEELHKELQNIIKENKDAPFGALMGMAVKQLQGKASGKQIAEMLQELLKDHKSMKKGKKIK
jgi:glutamyl-tRNA(Gln) amidotransferase subunit E